MDSIKDVIIDELEEKLVGILSNWFSKKTTEAEDKVNREKLDKLLQRADEVISRF
jgi:hypothetical protein